MTQVEKPIISTYPYGFEVNDQQQAVIKTGFDKQRPLKLIVHPDTELTAEDAVLRFRAENVAAEQDLPGFHLAGGFIFTLGRFVEEIPYDPYLYFHGEEQNLAIRAYTHGWDIFHPTKIPLYHLYKSPNQEHLNHHWHKEWEQHSAVKWPVLRKLAHQRLKALLYDAQSLGVYSLGSVRSLDDFAEFSGIDYPNRCLHRAPE